MLVSASGPNTIAVLGGTGHRSSEMNGSSLVVTGGGSGMGAATAAVLAREGARLCIADLELESAQQTASCPTNLPDHSMIQANRIQTAQ